MMCLNTKNSLQAIRPIVLELRNCVLKTSWISRLLVWSPVMVQLTV